MSDAITVGQAKSVSPHGTTQDDFQHATILMSSNRGVMPPVALLTVWTHTKRFSASCSATFSVSYRAAFAYSYMEIQPLFSECDGAVRNNSILF